MKVKIEKNLIHGGKVLYAGEAHEVPDQDGKRYIDRGDAKPHSGKTDAEKEKDVSTKEAEAKAKDAAK